MLSETAREKVLISSVLDTLRRMRGIRVSQTVFTVPPSATMLAPTTLLAAGDARKTTKSAISSGSVRRPEAILKIEGRAARSYSCFMPRAAATRAP